MIHKVARGWAAVLCPCKRGETHKRQGEAAAAAATAEVHEKPGCQDLIQGGETEGIDGSYNRPASWYHWGVP